MESLCAQIATVAERMQDKETELEAHREAVRYGDESIPLLIKEGVLKQDQILFKMGRVAEDYLKIGNKVRAQELINEVLKLQPQDKLALEVQRKLKEE